MTLHTQALAGALLAVAPVALPAEGEGVGLFYVNFGLYIATTLVFLALLGILWRFAWGPLLGAVQAREDRIQGALDESKNAQEEAVKLLEEHRAQLADARRQASELISEGKAAGERLRRELEEKARTEAQGIVEAARREIEREKDAALAELRKESVELALAAASKLMSEKMDQTKDRDLVVTYLDNMAAGPGAEA